MQGRKNSEQVNGGVIMLKLNEEKLANLCTADEVCDKEYGALGTPSRDAFEARAKAW